MRQHKRALNFILPSLLGVAIFLAPIPYNGQTTILIGIISGTIKSLLGVYGLHAVVGITILTNILTFLGTFVKARWIHEWPRAKELFDVSLAWVLVRAIGMAFGLMYFFQFGPELFLSEAIGGAVFIDIGVSGLSVFVSACILLPLLTDFGFMEYAGTLARPAFRKAFHLPGRSAIDALTSFVGASSIGLMITINQYDDRNYTQKQACVIATNFSIVSIPFCLVIASVSGIENLFLPWYGFVVFACLVAAFITPRLPPLAGKSQTFVDGTDVDYFKPANNAISLPAEAWQRALERAESAPNLRRFLEIGTANLMFFIFAITTASMALASLAMLIIAATPFFSWVGYPFIALLDLVNLPEATTAAPAVLSGYVDQYAPAITAKSVSSQATSFVLAGLSVTQLIFMSELGVIILRSSLPLSIVDLLLIFLLRTVIVLPVLIVGAHVVAG
jgi:nucleoside recognition membrane protein YjiH